MIRALALALTLSPLAPAEPLRIEARGSQICAGPTCYVPLPVGPTGLNLRGQMDRFHELFTDAMELKHAGSSLSFRQLLEVAGAVALDPAARAELELEFRRLVLTGLGVRLSPAPAPPDQKPIAESAPVEIAFVGTLAWTDARGATGSTSVRGHLTAPTDFKVDAGQAPADLNALLSPLITVDELAGGGPTAAQIKSIVGPAVMGNLIIALLSPVDQLKGSELEAVGRALQGDESTRPYL